MPCSQSTSSLVPAALQLVSQPDLPSVPLSWLCSLLPLPFPQQCTFYLVWCTFGVWNPLSLAVRQKGVGFLQEVSALLLSLCFLPGKKGFKFSRDPRRTPAWRSRAEFCSLCFPILFSGLLCSRLPFPWIWLPSGQTFYSLLHHGIAPLSVSAVTLQQTSSLSQWDPVCCSPLPLDCLRMLL